MSVSALVLRTMLTSLFVLLMLCCCAPLHGGHQRGRGLGGAPSPRGGAHRAHVQRPADARGARGGAPEDQAIPEKRDVLQQGLAASRAGRPVELRTLPVTRFLVFSTLGLTALGLLLLWLTSRVKSDAAQSDPRDIRGQPSLTGAVEYGLTIAARSLGIGKAVSVVDGQLVAVYGEYVLLKHTWGVMVLVMVYLLFLESSRCPVFLWWRKNVPTMRGPVVTGRIDNYGPRSAFQYATTVWGFYLLLLWAYDEKVFGVFSLVTKGILFFSIAGAMYCVWRLHKQTGWGPAVRYAVGAMIMVWTPLESRASGACSGSRGYCSSRRHSWSSLAGSRSERGRCGARSAGTPSPSGRPACRRLTAPVPAAPRPWVPRQWRDEELFSQVGAFQGPFPVFSHRRPRQLKLALQLVVVDPGLGGVLVFGDRGTAKSTAVRALAGLLPSHARGRGRPYHCYPAADGASCVSGCTVASRRKEGAGHRAPVPVVDLPLGATEDRVVGALDLEAALGAGETTFAPGLSRERTAASSYIDEVNLLPITSSTFCSTSRPREKMSWSAKASAFDIRRASS